jgi:hypothetical protein
MGAAGTALLISAAKQSGMDYDCDRLWWAISSTSRYLPDYGAYEQGAGLFQVGAAYEALKHAPTPVKIVTDAPVDASLSRYLRVPHRGSGIYEREGWTAGSAGRRAITFTRTAGDARAITYHLRWTGNDGTYQGPPTISLTLNEPATISLTIAPKSPGVHIAILDLDSPDGSRAVYRVMNTIVAAERLMAEHGFILVHQEQVGWMDSRSYYFYVPPETPALRLEIDIERGHLMPVLMRPSGIGYFVLADRPTHFTGYQNGGLWNRAVPRPETGVWELVIDNKDAGAESRLAESRASFKVRISMLGVRFEPPRSRIDSEVTDNGGMMEVTLNNPLDSFTGGVANTYLSSAFTAHPDVSSRKPQVYEITVPAGAAELNASIAGASDRPDDLDLYLFDCTGQECALKDFRQGEAASERVHVDRPVSGKWKIFIDPVSLSSGKTACTYSDSFTHPAFGAIITATARTEHRTGSTWRERVYVRVDAEPKGLRHLEAHLSVAADMIAVPDNDATRMDGRRSYSGQILLGTVTVRPIDRP